MFRKLFFYFVMALALGCTVPLIGLFLNADNAKMVALILLGNLLAVLIVMVYYEVVKTLKRLEEREVGVDELAVRLGQGDMKPENLGHFIDRRRNR